MISSKTKEENRLRKVLSKISSELRAIALDNITAINLNYLCKHLNALENLIAIYKLYIIKKEETKNAT